jgi:hypothetical protein
LDVLARQRKPSRLEVPELPADARAGQRVPEGLGADGDQICAPTQQVVGVTA